MRPPPPRGLEVRLAMPTASVRFETVTAVDAPQQPWPLPSWPDWYCPQQRTELSLMSAQPPPPPIDSPMALSTPGTACANVLKLPLLPVTCPRRLLPQHATEPSMPSAHATLWPMLTCVALTTVATWVGTAVVLSTCSPSLPTIC